MGEEQENAGGQQKGEQQEQKTHYIHIDIDRKYRDVDVPNPDSGLGYIRTTVGSVNPAEAELNNIQDRYPAGAKPIWDDGNPPTEIVLRSPSTQFQSDKSVGHSRPDSRKPPVRVSLIRKAWVTLDVYIRKSAGEGLYRRLADQAEMYGFDRDKIVRIPGGWLSLSDRIEADYESEDVGGIIGLYEAFHDELRGIEGEPVLTFTKKPLNV